MANGASTSTVVGGETAEFMTHAYNACFTGRIIQFEETLRSEMLRVVIDDVMTVVRTLPKKDQDMFLLQVEHRLKGGH